ncbi:MAG TPA: acetyl-CoA hydrolase/transferase C-terminal domain-containing protein [Nitrobacter sp.]|nr:acetyl-CoA hydrolase/transferase C-terminal domain-containing protein [Nitrobacter sp.]
MRWRGIEQETSAEEGATDMSGFGQEYRDKRLSDRGRVLLADNMTVYVNGATGLPNTFMQMLASEASALRGIRLCHPMRREVMALDPDPVAPTLAENIFHISDYTYDESIRRAVHEGRASYRPIHSSDGGRHFPYSIDVLVGAAAPMDRHGYFNLGPFGGWMMDFLTHARKVVLEVNPQQPVVFGDNYVHISQIDGIIEADYPIIEIRQSESIFGDTERAIARNVAALVEDGATVQAGVGSLPDAIAKTLMSDGHRDLGVHTESLFDWVVDLYTAGVVTNTHKGQNVGKMTAAMAIGSRALYEFIDRNPCVELQRFSYVNDPMVIARNHKPVSINATLQVDLSGQCASEGFGPRHHGGIGGQWNFHYGASLAPDGKGIIALPSTARKGSVSRIVPSLTAGSAVSITRNDIHYVVTEYGVADLRGRPLDERAKLLIGIAHPRFRDELARAAREVLGLHVHVA